MPPGVEELTFSFGTVVQIVTLVVAAVGSWFYLRNRFEQNATQLANVNKTLSALDTKLDTKFGDLEKDMQKQNESIIKIEAHGTVLEDRISTLNDRVTAMAGPRAR